MSQIEPMLKWAGGKRWLVASKRSAFPKVDGAHIEPFVGSGAAFFALEPRRAILSDLNHRLMETYLVVKEDVGLFERYFRGFAAQHSPEFYYELRKKKFRSAVKRAAQFVYLNRVCFNGIYRENLKGEFNVPIGSKTSALLETDNFPAVSELLSGAQLMTGDFEAAVDLAGRNDFLYIDPPYTTKHNLNGFIKYNQKIFSWDDQVRLAEALLRASGRGVKILVSNADHVDVRSLYEDAFYLSSVPRNNVIAAQSSFRGRTSELLAANFVV